MVCTPSDLEELFIGVAVLSHPSPLIWRSGTVNKAAELRVSSFFSGNNRNCWKPWRSLKQDPTTTLLRVSKQTIASSRWVSNAVSQLRVNNPNTAGCDRDISVQKQSWTFYVVIAEKAFLSRGHSCIVCYHGDPVKLGERFADRADWVAVLLPQKQEAVRVASRPGHQERWLPRESGGACQRKGEGESLPPASASCLNDFCYTKCEITHQKLAMYNLY